MLFGPHSQASPAQAASAALEVRKGELAAAAQSRLMLDDDEHDSRAQRSAIMRDTLCWRAATRTSRW
jgi:hypothetical protein